MLYKLGSGPVKDESYGIRLAGAVGFPPHFLEVAEHVSSALREHAEEKKRSSGARKVVLKRKLILNLREALQIAHSSQMDDGALASYLRRLQAEFLQRMEDYEATGPEAMVPQAYADEVVGVEVVEIGSESDSE
jgi:DNA mismatch repair protein MSH4